jgi:hypothetical protein
VLNYSNTIIANSSAGGDCVIVGGTIGTNSNNLVEDGSCSAGGVNFLTGDPLLGLLRDNGGPTQTMALLTGTPAIDAGSLADCPATDQRGVSRPQGAGCDIGSFESTGGEPTTTTITTDTPDPSLAGQSVAVSVTVSGGSSTPTGTVDITGADTNCQISLSGGTGSCEVVFTSGGDKTLTAIYNGDATYAGSLDTEPHSVRLLATTTTITADMPDPSVPNQNVAVTVTVSGESSTPTGTVDITGADTNCQIILVSGSRSCDVVFNTSGAKTLTATYYGDPTHEGSSDTEAHVVWLMQKFVSQPGNDGWVLESGENGSVGGSMNATATTLRVGDDAQDRQYRSILSFNTAGLPDSATIKMVRVLVKESSVTGSNPFARGGLKADITKPYFGAGPGLALNDFQAGASLLQACSIGAPAVNNWHKCRTAESAFPYVNKTGTTQLRLRFVIDDNDDLVADVLNLFSGNAISANRPYIIVYYMP